MMIVRTYKFPGIYAIRNKVTGRAYYGQAKIVSRRLTNELSLLRNNQHHSIHLQRSYNKHGEENFEIVIIHNLSFLSEEFRPMTLDYLEDEIIKITKPNYNRRNGGRSQYIISEETLVKLRPKRKAMWLKEGFRENQSNHQVRTWKDQEYRDHQTKKKKQYWKDPEIRAKYLAAINANWQNPEYRKRQIEKIREGIRKAKEANGGKIAKSWSEKRSENFKNRWKDPETRAKMIKAMKEGWSKKKALANPISDPDSPQQI
jgi:hypothetical protein